MLAEREERERKQLRKRDRERQRLADGDAHISEESDSEQEPLSDWSASSSQEENDSELGVQDFQGAPHERGGATPSVTKDGRSMFKKTHSKISDLNDLGMRFNALRFLAMSLKSQNDTMGK